MSIRRKLVIAFVVLGGLIATMVVLAVGPLERGVRDVGQFHAPAFAVVQSMKANVNGAIQETHAYVVTGRDVDRDEHQAFLTAAEADARKFREVAYLDEPGEEAEAAMFASIRADQTRLVATSSQLMDQRAAGIEPSLADLEVFDAHAASLQWRLAELARIEEAEVLAAQKSALGIINRAEQSLLLIGLAALLFAIVLAVFVARGITRPLERLTQAAVRVAAGDRRPVDVAGTDEVAVLGRAFNDMIGEVETTWASLESAVAERTNELETLNASLRASEERYRTLVQDAPEGIIVLDVERRCLVDANPGACAIFKMDLSALLGCDPVQLSPARQPDGRSSASSADAHIADAMAGETTVFEWEHLDGTGGRVPCEIRLARHRSEDDSCLLRVSVIDITERRREQERRRLLERELNHRVRNNLTAVLALMEQTIDSSRSLADFGEAFAGRLHAMARTHEALARNHWSGVPLTTAVQTTLASYSYGSDRISAHGDDVPLPARMVAPLGLVLHELATNAVKHGALATPGGAVAITWTYDGDTIDLQWIETGTDVSEPPAEGDGLGLCLITGLVEHELRGRLDMRFEPPGFSCRLTLPVEARGETDALGFRAIPRAGSESRNSSKARA